MGQLTSRAGLYLPGGGSTGTNLPDEPADIDKINDNFRTVDRLLGARTVPSAASYTDSFDGDLVIPEDDEILRMYSASKNGLVFPRTRGGTRYVGTRAEREAFTDAKRGDSWWDIGSLLELVYTGTVWRYTRGQQLLVSSGSGSATASGSAYVLMSGVSGSAYFPSQQVVKATLMVASSATALAVIGARIMRNNTDPVGVAFNGPANSSPTTTGTGNHQVFITRATIPAGDHSFAGQFNLAAGGGVVTASSSCLMYIETE